MYICLPEDCSSNNLLDTTVLLTSLHGTWTALCLDSVKGKVRTSGSTLLDYKTFLNLKLFNLIGWFRCAIKVINLLSSSSLFLLLLLLSLLSYDELTFDHLPEV